MRTYSLLGVLVLSACSAHRAPPAASAKASPPREVAAPKPPPSPREALAEADLAYVSQLGASRGGRFDTERQIFVLQRAVELYTQFLERAVGRPELGGAVKRSQERLADARETIVFLQQSLHDDAQGP